VPVGLFRSAGIFDRRIFIMSEAMKLIVEGYSSLKNREALEDLRAHRERLRNQLQERSPGGVDTSLTIETLNEDLRIIEAAINKH
jgi:hypothetical protein